MFVSVLLPLPKSTLPVMTAAGLPGVVPLPLLLTVSLPLPRVMLPVMKAGLAALVGVLVIVVVPDEVILP